MAESFVTEFSQPQRDSEPRNLLSQLYREIGLSAVAAALDIGDARQAFSPGSKRFISQSERSAFLGDKMVA
jgi:hypothetical protein